MKQIFEPVKMNHIELKNRLIRSATWEGIANPDGSVTSEAYEIYEELAKGGIGAIITGFTSVACSATALCFFQVILHALCRGRLPFLLCLRP